MTDRVSGLPQVPWAADATQEQAQAAFDDVQAKARVAMESLQRGEAVTVIVGPDMTSEAVRTVQESLDFYHVHHLQRGLLRWEWTEPGKLRGSPVLPALPAACRSCGAAVAITNTDIRLIDGEWYHACAYPQAGTFPC